MPSLLASEPAAYVLSTFQPSCVARSKKDDYTYTFDADNRVVYQVAGGSTYKHLVWNYVSDTLVATHSSCFGLKTTLTNYNVERRRIDDDHQLILLLPSVSVVSYLFPIHKWLSGNILNRLNMCQQVGDQKFLRLDVQSAEGTVRHTGVPGMHAVASVTPAQDDTIGLMRTLSPNTLMPAQTMQAVPEITREAASVLTSYHRASGHAESERCTLAPIAHLQYSPHDYDPDAKHTLTPFMKPLVVGKCFAFDQTRANDAQGIEGRIKQPRREADPTPLGENQLLHQKEFIDFLAPENPLTPLDFDVVWERQSRPSQRRLLEEALLSAGPSDRETVKSFIKAESYAKVTDPRIITIIGAIPKVRYSRYIYALSDYLRAKELLWYSVAKTPKAVAHRVAEICSTNPEASLGVALTDFSRMDGHVCAKVRDFEKALMTRFFRGEDHAELLQLMSQQHHCPAVSRNGEKYDTEYERGSGSAETIEFNTLLTGLIAYTGNRTYLDPPAAMASLGAYLGDDGLTPLPDPKHKDSHVNAARAYGQVVELEYIPRGAYGVSYLAREYGQGVWFGDVNSMCDIPRQLAKFHVTPNLPPHVSALAKLGEKALSFHYTDRNTPVIGDFVSMIVKSFPQILPAKLGGLRRVAQYHSLVEENEQYPNDVGNWAPERFLQVLPTFALPDFYRWLLKVENQSDPKRLLEPPTCDVDIFVSPKVPKPVVINGEVALPTEATYRPTTPTEPPTVGDQPGARSCMAFRDFGTCKKGSACKYAHRPAVGKCAHTFKECPQGPACPRAHSKS